MNDRLDDLLHQAGRSFPATPPVVGPDLPDVARRSRVRARHQRLVAVAIAVAVLLTGATALVRTTGATHQADLRTGDADGHRSPTTSPPTPVVTPAPTTPSPATGPAVVPPATATTPTTANRPGSVREVDWANFTFPAGSCASVPDGPVQARPKPSRAPDLDPSVHVAGMQFSDVDGDGSEEAVFMLDCLGHPTDVHFFVYGVDGAGGLRKLSDLRPEPAVVARLRTSYGVRDLIPRSVWVSDGVAGTEWIGYGPDDPACCPRSRVTLSSRLVGGAITSEIARVDRPS